MEASANTVKLEKAWELTENLIAKAQRTGLKLPQGAGSQDSEPLFPVTLFSTRKLTCSSVCITKLRSENLNQLRI